MPWASSRLRRRTVGKLGLRGCPADLWSQLQSESLSSGKREAMGGQKWRPESCRMLEALNSGQGTGRAERLPSGALWLERLLLPLSLCLDWHAGPSSFRESSCFSCCGLSSQQPSGAVSCLCLTVSEYLWLLLPPSQVSWDPFGFLVTSGLS